MLRNIYIAAAFFLSTVCLFATDSFAQSREFGQRTQETVPVGNNRFLIFVGAENENVIGYTVDMIQVENGIPFYVPLFIEDYDAETNRAKLSYGVAFFASNYVYERGKNIMTIKSYSPSKTLYQLTYRLDGDIFHLLKVTATESSGRSTMLFQASPKS